ncbi:MAG: alpha-ketoglutarate-dependent dioxygenase AlkB family protein [Flavobacteriales bacterium]|jgi:alkylated DNA repair dioxygenase AlkB|tara:strand:- start:313 stop:921 length:609 start_codon:yes stop_codon:yes gene_type:complete
MIDSQQISKKGELLLLNDAKIRYFESFFSQNESRAIFNHLHDETPWQQDPITVYGKTYPQPRLTALYAKNTKSYTYSGIKMQPKVMSPMLLEIQKKIATICPTDFTTVLLNLYRDGKDSNGWHADNEKELGENPVIASLSLGEARFFHLKHRRNKEDRLKLLLASGSLLIMEGSTQKHWLHQIAKTARPVGSRINLTFRKII